MTGKGLRRCFTWSWLLAASVVAPVPGIVHAAWVPSSDLSFRVTLAPDSITVGDPIALEMDGSAPDGGNLLVPTLADTIGQFSVLDREAPNRGAEKGRIHFAQRMKVTLYRSGTAEFPALPLLWVGARGDTQVAYSRAQTIEVASLLPKDADLSNPQAALQQLRDLKGVVPLTGFRWWLWGPLAAVLVALGVLLYLRLRRRRAAVVPEPVAVRSRRKLPPEIAFERGLDALYESRVLEQGKIKEFYAGVSLLLRRYLEDRFHLPAVEATRPEILGSISASPRLNANDRRWLTDWLSEGDLVKFAKMERLLVQAKESAEAARGWVRETTRRVPPPAPEPVAGTPVAPGAADPAVRAASGAGAPAVPVASGTGGSPVPAAPGAGDPAVPAAPGPATRGGPALRTSGTEGSARTSGTEGSVRTSGTEESTRTAGAGGAPGSDGGPSSPHSKAVVERRGGS